MLPVISSRVWLILDISEGTFCLKISQLDQYEEKHYTQDLKAFNLIDNIALNLTNPKH